MKNSLNTLLALMAGTMALAACSEDVIVENNTLLQPDPSNPSESKLVPMTFLALQENEGETRTLIDGTSIKWSEGDKICIFDDSDANCGNQCFTLTEGANTTEGVFSGEASEDVGSYLALYPYVESISINATKEDCLNAGVDEHDLDYYYRFWAGHKDSDPIYAEFYISGNMTYIQLTPEQQNLVWSYLKGGLYFGPVISDGHIGQIEMPAVQTLKADSHVDESAMLMIAQSTEGTTDLKFKNVVSYFKFTAPFDCNFVTISDNADAGKMAGTITLDYNNGEPNATITNNGASFITLNGSIKAGETYYIATLPQTFSQGITMMFAKTDGLEYVKSTTKSYTLGRNKVSNMGTPEVSLLNPPYVTFSADGTQTLTMSVAVEGMEYSVGGSVWSTLGTNTVTFGNGQDLRLRSTNGHGTAGLSDIFPELYSQVIFGNDTKVACSGDLRTLVNYRNYENANTANAGFFSLFERCSQLTSAPDLPATVLADFCYDNMFFECTSLTTAPALPATRLSESCYSTMFYGCTGLTAAPTLPATQLARNCYNHMFTNCTNLTTASALPADMMYEYCCESMFENCPNLTTAPELPATQLAERCYQCMFYGCSSLTTAPELPATQLAPYCYNQMFIFCNNLTTAPILPAKTLVNGCYDLMFYSCKKLNYLRADFTTEPNQLYTDDWLLYTADKGTFVKNPESTWDVWGDDGIPTGWTVITE